MTNDEMLIEWQKASTLAKQHSEREKELRSMIFGTFFGDLEEGTTHNHALGNGYKLTGKRPLNYKLSVELTDHALIEIEAMGNSGPFVAERLVKWEPKLSLTEYNNLTDEQRAAIDKALTVTPGLPSLELKEPKGK